MELCIQHVVLYALSLQHIRKKLRFVDGDCADKHGLAFFVAFADLVDYRVILACHGFVNKVVHITAHDGLVCGYFNDVEAVYLTKLRFFGERRTGHAGKLFVHSEVILEGYCRLSLVFTLDLAVFLRFDCLMQTV